MPHYEYKKTPVIVFEEGSKLTQVCYVGADPEFPDVF
jgi:hypothetical protein